MKIKILSVLKGPIAKLNGEFLSGIRKHPCPEIQVFMDHIHGNGSHNLKYHGGNKRVIHHYTEAHYSYFKKKFQEIADRFVPGSYGENIYTQELTERDLCMGDIFTAGTTKIQLTASRRPCATINLSYQDNRILKEIAQSGRVGWFYQVLEEGTIKTGDMLELVERPYPDLRLDRLFTEGYLPKVVRDIEFLQACLDSELMEKGWKPALEKLLRQD